MNRSRDWLAQALRDLEKAKTDSSSSIGNGHALLRNKPLKKAVKALLMARGKDAWGHAITPMLRAASDWNVPTRLIEAAQLLVMRRVVLRKRSHTTLRAFPALS